MEIEVYFIYFLERKHHGFVLQTLRYSKRMSLNEWFIYLVRVHFLSDTAYRLNLERPGRKEGRRRLRRCRRRRGLWPSGVGLTRERAREREIERAFNAGGRVKARSFVGEGRGTHGNIGFLSITPTSKLSRRIWREKRARKGGRLSRIKQETLGTYMSQLATNPTSLPPSGGGRDRLEVDYVT